MDSILADLTDPPSFAVDLTEGERESLEDLQHVLDIVRSPLFSALIDIRDQCKKVHVASYAPPKSEFYVRIVYS